MDVFERDVTVATSVFGSMEFSLVDPPSTLAFEGDVTFRTEKVSCSNAVIFKDIQALADFTATAASARGTIIWLHGKMSAIISADM
jgi:hypothetical protein